MALDPFCLTPVRAPKPWGGDRLKALGKPVPAATRVGESWEVADLPADAVSTVPDPRSRVASGPLRGMSLREVIEAHGDTFLGSAQPTPAGDFPLLVKLLDAGENLSVQVHPHDAYVARHPGARLKTESWYVMDAAPGAELFLGFEPGVTADDVGRAAGGRGFVDLLRRVPARRGGFHHVPAGTVHALGAGILLAEVQTPSDTTFRIYDWTEEYGRAPRDMHVAEALETLMVGDDPPAAPPPPGPTRTLVANEHYWIVEHRGDGAMLLDTAAETRVLMVVEGNITVDGLAAAEGTTIMVPASTAPTVSVRAARRSIVLEIGLARRPYNIQRRT
jgi:mannose-6-phosphate isomerase